MAKTAKVVSGLLALAVLSSLARMAGHRVELEKSNVWPDMTVGLFGERNVSSYPVGGGDETDSDNILGLEISLPLPLWNRRRGEILEAEVERRRLGVQVEALNAGDPPRRGTGRQPPGAREEHP